MSIAGLPVKMRSEWRRRSYLSWLALACTVLLAVLAWDTSVRRVRDRVDTQFKVRSDQLAEAVRQRMLDNETLLRGAAALFLASQSVNRQEFRAYVHHLQMARYYPGIQALGFAALLSAQELSSAELAIRDEGFSTFSVRPSGVRPSYAPIVYIEPFARDNVRAFGFDMMSEPHRRVAMERATRTGTTSASAIVRLVQEPERHVQPGFLVYMPVARPADEGAQRVSARPLGFVYMALRAHDLVRGILGSNPDDLDYALFDAEQPQPFFDTRPAGTVAAESELSSTRSLAIAGRTWTLRMWSRPSFGVRMGSSEPLWVLLVGVVINLLLFYIFASGSALDRRAQSLAAEMTQALTLSHAREQSQMLASLREKETLLKEIHHRVKNNLQVVSSLLSLQTNHTLDARAMEPLVQSRQRVLTMAALHEFLYQSSDLAHVDTRAYLTHLVTMVSNSYQDAARVTLELRLDDIPLDLDRAIPCGLITNELVSNAFKYAFPGRTDGKLTVALSQHDDRVVLEVADDGPGLPERVDASSPQTLGLQLVRLLSEQLHADLTVTRSAGTRYELSFRNKAAKAAA